jgi:hypothetical protein
MTPWFLLKMIEHIKENSSDLVPITDSIPDSQCNKEALSKIKVEDHRIKFKSSGKDLADLAWDLESLEFPEKLKEKYSEEEWESFTRLATLFFSSRQ